MADVHRIEVGITQADGIKNAIITDLGITSVEKVIAINVYTIDGGELSSSDLDLVNPVIFPKTIPFSTSIIFIVF